MKSPELQKPRHSLLVHSRNWHKWGGLAAGLFLIVVATSGIILNYKQPLFSVFGLETKEAKPDKSRERRAAGSTNSRFTTQTSLDALPVGFDRALDIARGEWGDASLERIELKDERGELVYKIKRKSGDELWVNGITGTHFIKGEYEKVASTAAGATARRTDWGKILLDLHTGKIGGAVGKAIMSIVAFVLLLMTFSGFYLWLKPFLMRRAKARACASVDSAVVRHASPRRPATVPIREPVEA